MGNGSPCDPAVSRKVAWRLIPLLGLAYVLGQLDRVNVSFAALTMNADLGFSPAVYGLGAGLFFIGYVFFQIPSNLILERVGARRLLATIMVIWGVLSSATALVSSAAEFYVIRLLLGAAESGLYPGAMLYLTYWFGERERAMAVGWFALSVPVAGLLGSPLSGWILDVSADWGLLAGWQWLFILEGMPSVLVALLVLTLLTDRPEQAAWLSAAEKRHLADITAPAPTPAAVSGHHDARDWYAILILSVSYFFFAGALVGSLYWIPKALEALAPGVAPTVIGWLVGLPYLLFAFGTLYWGHRSDRTGRRRGHVLAAFLLASGGLLLLALADRLSVGVVAVCLILLGGGAGFSTFWGLATSALVHRDRALGIAVVNVLGSLGSFATIYLGGVAVQATGGYLITFAVMAAAGICGALSIAFNSNLGRSHHVGSIQ